MLLQCAREMVFGRGGTVVLGVIRGAAVETGVGVHRRRRSNSRGAVAEVLLSSSSGAVMEVLLSSSSGAVAEVLLSGSSGAVVEVLLSSSSGDRRGILRIS
eukprot:g15844.t1